MAEVYPKGYQPAFFGKIQTSLYGKFVEAWYHFSGSGLKKERVQELANEDWRNYGEKEKHELIKKHIRSLRKRKSTFSFGIYKKKVDSNIISDNNETMETTDTAAGSSKSPTTSKHMETANASAAATDPVDYVLGQRRSTIDIFLASLDSRCRQLLDDPSLKTLSVLDESLFDVSQIYNSIHSFFEYYEKGKQNKRESALSETLKSMCEKRNELKELVIEALELKIDTVLGLSILRANGERKELLFKDIAISCLSFTSFLRDSKIKQRLTKRLGQIQKITDKSTSEKTILVCNNNAKLTWEEAFDNLIGEVNSYDMDVYNTGMLMQNSAVLIVKDHLSDVKGNEKICTFIIGCISLAVPQEREWR